MTDVDGIFDLAKKHPFYADRYRDVTSFADAPTTEKPELYRVINKAFDEDRSFRESIYLSPTGGSTPDRLLYFPTDIQDNELQRKLLSPYLNEAKIFTPSSIVLNIFGSNMMYRALEIFNDFAERGQATVLPAGSQCEDALATEIALRFGADSLIGNPSRVLQFARYVESHAIPLRFEHLIFGGETLQQHKADFIQRVLGVKRISGIYGSAESGIWGYQPDDLELNCYFYPPEIMHIEILEPDSDGFGRMVLTNLVRTRTRSAAMIVATLVELQKQIIADNNGTCSSLKDEQRIRFSLEVNIFHSAIFRSRSRTFWNFRFISHMMLNRSAIA